MRKLPAFALAATAAFAAPAFADTVTYTAADRVVVYDVDPLTGAYAERSTTYLSPAPALTYDTTGDVSHAYRAPVITNMSPAPVTYVADEIVVTAPRRDEDRMINDDVTDRIASDPRISGQVGVETYRNNVTLTGRVASPAQVDRAATDARSVPGVREVNNELRARVGNF